MQQGRFHGAEFEVRRLSGAVVSRIVHPSAQSIAEHSHDWPVLSLYRLGAYQERGEAGDIPLDGPSVVFHPAGAPHADEVFERGLETLVIEFDPDWLGEPLAGADGGSLYWSGGMVAAEAERLARVWHSPDLDETVLKGRTSAFLSFALATPSRPASPRWMGALDTVLDDPLPADTRGLAQSLDLHPAWLARAYRAARGEGLREAQRRRRVERAVRALRTGAVPLAEIALDAGFCDQSHMNRSFRAVLGRTPTDVREETQNLRIFGI